MSLVLAVPAAELSLGIDPTAAGGSQVASVEFQIMLFAPPALIRLCVAAAGWSGALWNL